MDTIELQVRMGDRLVTDLTAAVVDFCHGRGDRLVNVFVPHATAGLAVVETGSGTEHDLAELIDRVLPADDRYRHRHGTRGHGRDHVLPALVSPSLCDLVDRQARSGGRSGQDDGVDVPRAFDPDRGRLLPVGGPWSSHESPRPWPQPSTPAGAS